MKGTSAHALRHGSSRWGGDGSLAFDLSPVRSLNSGLPGWNSLAFTLGEPLAKYFLGVFVFAFVRNSFLALSVFYVFDTFFSQYLSCIGDFCERWVIKKVRFGPRARSLRRFRTKVSGTQDNRRGTMHARGERAFASRSVAMTEASSRGPTLLYVFVEYTTAL